MAAQELDAYLRYGNIKNSVNFPNVDMPFSSSVRLCILHANVPAMLSQITQTLSEEGINIENLTNKSKGDNAYTMVDVSAEPKAESIAKLESIADIFRVRIIK